MDGFGETKDRSGGPGRTLLEVCIEEMKWNERKNNERVHAVVDTGIADE